MKTKFDLPEFKKARVQSVKLVPVNKGRDTSWRVDYTLDGKRGHKLFDTEAKARDFATFLTGYVVGRRSIPLIDGTEVELGKTFFQMLEDQLKINTISESTYATYLEWFKSYFESTGRASTPLQKINYDWIVNLRQELNIKSNGTKFKSAMILLKKTKDYISTKNSSDMLRILNIPADLKSFNTLVSQKTSIQSYSLEQYQALVNFYNKTIDPEKKYRAAVFIFAVNSACRISELITLRWSNVSYEDETLSVLATLTKTVEGKKIKDGSKTNAYKTIPLNPVAFKALKVIKDMQVKMDNQGTRDFIIKVTSSRRRDKYVTDVSGTTVKTWLGEICAEVGIPYLAPHKAFRKTIATLIATKTDMNPFELADIIGGLLGHKGSATALEYYIKPVVQKKAQKKVLNIMNDLGDS